MGEKEGPENSSNEWKVRTFLHVNMYVYHKSETVFDKVPKLFFLFQLESFDKNKDGEIELSEMAKLVPLV